MKTEGSEFRVQEEMTASALSFPNPETLNPWILALS
jgi:hypothetical protein